MLVVEDEALLSKQLASALGDAGYAVDCAADGTCWASGSGGRVAVLQLNR